MKVTEDCMPHNELHVPRDFANHCRFVFVFLVLHIMVFVFGMMNYGLTVRLKTLQDDEDGD
jgi:hypothetical protein